MRFVGVCVLLLIFGLPLLGVWLAGRPVAEVFRFPPPLEIPGQYVRFSWLAAGAVMALLVVTFLPWCRRRTGGVVRAGVTEASGAELVSDAVDRRHAVGAGSAVAAAEVAARRGRRLPWWGWLALVWTAGWWVLAWTRWPAFAVFQKYTFFPLWVGFVVAMNALAEARSGTCLLRRAPGRWLGLFAASAGCWWAFEWLNRFVRNWHYLNVEEFGAAAYALHATLCFSTVLPALAAVAEWLEAHAGWRRSIAEGPRWSWLGGPRAWWWLAGGGAVALVGAGAMPDWFYPALWIGPLALLLTLPEPAGGGQRLAREIAAGDWGRAATWMVAGLICGFFWELWNWHSVAKWIYTVPGVERWHVFEMPALGYAGYLPFGLECLLVAERVIGEAWRSPGAGRGGGAGG